MNIDSVLVGHVSLPVVFSREGFATLSGIRAIGLRAVKLACLHVLIVDVTIQVRFCAESVGAARMWARVWSIVISFVVAI